MNTSLNYVEFEGLVVQVALFDDCKKVVIASVNEDTGEAMKNYIVAVFKPKYFPKGKDYSRVDKLTCNRVRVIGHLKMTNSLLYVVAEEFQIIEC